MGMNILIAVMGIMALAAGIWCFRVENGRFDSDSKEEKK